MLEQGRPHGVLCIVAGLDNPASPADAAELTAASDLVRRGWDVHVLDCDSDGSQHTRRLMLDPRIRVHRISDFPRLPQYPISTIPDYLRLAAETRYAIEQIHAEHRLDLVQFPEHRALGFRAVQAQRTACGLCGVGSIVLLTGSTLARREAAGRWMWDLHELEVEYCERYSFVHANFRMTGNPELADHARRCGWPGRVDIVAGDGQGLVRFYEACLNSTRETRARQATTPRGDVPLVSVALTYHNLPAFLPAALDSLANQTYPKLEVIVIDDGSTDTEAVRVFQQERERHPNFDFRSRENRGLSETRNEALFLASGEYYIPVDADNIAAPNMVAALVTAIENRNDASAFTCFHMSFRTNADIRRGRFLYDAQPVGGPYLLGALHNVYGDSNAIFRTADLRSVGGYDSVPGATCEDWEVFVKLNAAGMSTDVVPEHLFLYRYRDNSLLRSTDEQANHLRVLRRYIQDAALSPANNEALWIALVSMHGRQKMLRYHVADRAHALVSRVPFLQEALVALIVSFARVRRRIVSAFRDTPVGYPKMASLINPGSEG